MTPAPVRALVVDDEPHARANVVALLAAEPRWQVIGTCDSAAAVRDAVAAEIPAAVFLDVRLPGDDGVQLARQLQRLTPAPLVVFTTAHDAYAVSAFELQAIDYLLKPFEDQRFRMALRRVEQALASSAARPTDAPDPYLRRVVIRSIGRVQLVDVADIEWLEASGNYIEIHTAAASYLHRERLRVLEDQLDPADFVRIHRSIIVRRGAVVELRPLPGGDYSVVLRNGRPLRMSRTYRPALDSIARAR
jgi:two-component system LytT family response regulator